MKSEKGNMILLTIIASATLLVAVVGATFAYFGATMGSESPKTIEVTSGTLSIEHQDNSALLNYGANLGDVILTKEFYVTGIVTGSTNLNYEVIINAKNNTYTDNALVYTLTSVNESNNGSTIASTTAPIGIPSGTSTISLGNGFFAGPTTTGSVHKYILTIMFANDGPNNFEKTFEGNIKIVQTKK